MKKVLFLIIIFIYIGFLKGAVIQLKDGTMIQGKIIKQDSLKVEVTDEKGIIQIIPREKIAKIMEESSLIPSFIIEQERIKEAGAYLRTHANWYFAGFALQTIGVLFMTASSFYEYRYEELPVLSILGVGFYLGGGLTSLVSHYFIHQAGKSLEKAIEK